MTTKKEIYRHAGIRTPQYYCKKCKRAHTIHSKIGMKHYQYARRGE